MDNHLNDFDEKVDEIESQNKKNKNMDILVTIILLIICIPVALFVGKTTLVGWHITNVERPITAFLFYCTMATGIFNY